MKVLFTGSGTAGPVIPLIAIHETLKDTYKENYTAVWIGDDQGPVRSIVDRYNIEFIGIHAFKLHRYFTVKLFTDFFLGLKEIPNIIRILRSFRPDCILSVGGYVSVLPVIIGWCMRIPVLIHQQDYLPGLANRIMAPFASRITCTFNHHIDVYGTKAVKTGNPVRRDIRNINTTQCDVTLSKLGLGMNKPLVLVTGGGTGAEKINNAIYKHITELVQVSEVVHLTGAGKGNSSLHLSGYHQHEFLYDEMPCLLAHASIIVSRAGLSTLTELSFLGKASIIVPMKHSHQEWNVSAFGDSIIGLDQDTLDNTLVSTIVDLLKNPDRRHKFEESIKTVLPTRAVESIVLEIEKLVK